MPTSNFLYFNTIITQFKSNCEKAALAYIISFQPIKNKQIRSSNFNSYTCVLYYIKSDLLVHNETNRSGIF